MTGSDGLASVVAKFERARDQYVTLDNEVPGRRGKFQPHSVRRESNDDGTEYRFYLGIVEPPDPAWSLLFGELMFNLRCALDHLVYALHVRHLGKPPAGRDARQIAFPIFSCHPTVPGSTELIPVTEWKTTKRLPPDEQALIELLQPYDRRNDEFASTRYALKRLNRLQNRDKHRALHLVRSTVDSIAVPQFAAEFGFRHDYTFGPVESGAQVDVWHFAKAPPQMPVHMGVFVDVAIEERPGKFSPVVVTAESFVNEVGNVIGRFSDRFPGEWPYPVA